MANCKTTGVFPPPLPPLPSSSSSGMGNLDGWMTGRMTGRMDGKDDHHHRNRTKPRILYKKIKGLFIPGFWIKASVSGVHKDKCSYILLGQCLYILLLSLSLSPPHKHNVGEWVSAIRDSKPLFEAKSSQSSSTR